MKGCNGRERDIEEKRDLLEGQRVRGMDGQRDRGTEGQRDGWMDPYF